MSSNWHLVLVVKGDEGRLKVSSLLKTLLTIDSCWQRKLSLCPQHFQRLRFYVRIFDLFFESVARCGISMSSLIFLDVETHFCQHCSFKKPSFLQCIFRRLFQKLSSHGCVFNPQALFLSYLSASLFLLQYQAGFVTMVV